MGLYLLIVDVTVCKVTPVILHGVVFPDPELSAVVVHVYVIIHQP